MKHSDEILKKYAHYLIGVYTTYKYEFRIISKEVIRLIDGHQIEEVANIKIYDKDLYNDIIYFLTRDFQKIETKLEKTSSNKKVLSLEEYSKIERRKETIQTLL